MNKSLENTAVDILEEEDLKNTPFDFSKSIRVNGRDTGRFVKEIDRKGWKGVVERLHKEGLGNKKIGYIYR